MLEDLFLGVHTVQTVLKHGWMQHLMLIAFNFFHFLSFTLNWLRLNAYQTYQIVS